MHRHTGIVSDNVIRLRNFYCSVFDLKVTYAKTETELDSFLGIKESEAFILKLSKDDQTVIELLNFNRNKMKKKIHLNSKGITHFALTVEDVYSSIGKCLDNGGQLVGEVKNTSEVIVAFIQDPDGNKIEIVQEL
jgi:predicted enzyme related to lactoylglutathione lyase